MPLFIGVHDMGQYITDEQMKDNWAKYLDACEKHGAKGHKVYYNGNLGRAYCVTEAPSADDVTAAHDDVGVPLKDIIQVEKIS